MIALLTVLLNKLQQAVKLHQEAHELAVKTHNLRAEIVNHVSGAYLWLSLGDLERAEATVKQSIVRARKLGSRLMEGTALGYQARIFYHQGKREAACRVALESLKVLRETEGGVTFRLPATLGVLALATSDETIRREAWQEAEALLSAGSISHNHANFYEDAIETCLRLGEWDEVERFALALETYTSAEPIPRCSFVIARGRALATFAQDLYDEHTLVELQRLYEYSKESKLMLSLPALETALSQI